MQQLMVPELTGEITSIHKDAMQPSRINSSTIQRKMRKGLKDNAD